MFTTESYFLHLLSWTVPVLILQWGIAGRKILRNRRVILGATLISTLYYSIADAIAIGDGVWYFDPAYVSGWEIGVVPVEEILFFFITSLLVSQSIVMFLPRERTD